MRRLLTQIRTQLQSFVDQRDDVALVLCAAESDALPLLSILEGIEAERAPDFFWTFTEPFAEVTSYAETIVQAFAVKHAAVRLAMDKDGMNPWPPLPPAVQAASTPPAKRLRELAAFSRGLLPIPNGGVVVWTFFPLSIADSAAYAGLMAEVIAHEFPFPWCHHLRFVLRVDPAERAVERALERAPRVRRYAPDLSLDALNRSVEDEVLDESLPLAERMAVLPVSASNDLAYERFPTALEKYALLLRYHGSMNNYAMAALALHGMGQAYERMNDLDNASEAYQAALIPASHGEHPAIPVLLNVVLSLANLRMMQERWGEAEGYWDTAQQLATVSRDGPLKVRTLDQRGACQQRQGNVLAAEQSWRSGAIIAARLQDTELRDGLVGRLRALYAAHGNSGKVDEFSEYLKQLAPRGEG
jgi:tetratricopeptide (TPR) repeat protein